MAAIEEKFNFGSFMSEDIFVFLKGQIDITLKRRQFSKEKFEDIIRSLNKFHIIYNNLNKSIKSLKTEKQETPPDFIQMGKDIATCAESLSRLLLLCRKKVDFVTCLSTFSSSNIPCENKDKFFSKWNDFQFKLFELTHYDTPFDQLE